MLRLLTVCLMTIGFSSWAAAAPKIVTSIMPVHAIVAAVMKDVGEPELLLSGRVSEHIASFTPEQIKALGESDAVFIIGHGLEFKLAELSGSEAVNGRAFVSLAAAPGVRTLAIRSGGAWQPHRHEDDGAEAGHGHDDDHDHGDEAVVSSFDPHVWLDPENARAMAQAVAVELGRIDPGNAAAYAVNATQFAVSLDRLSAEVSRRLAPVKDKPFIVFHDAFQYFEARFGLNGVGSIADVSAAQVSAKRLGEIRGRLAETGAVCVFREPQFDSRLVETVLEGSAARAGVLDGLGADVAPGPEAYFDLLRGLAASLGDCLGA